MGNCEWWFTIETLIWPPFFQLLIFPKFIFNHIVDKFVSRTQNKSTKIKEHRDFLPKDPDV